MKSVTIKEYNKLPNVLKEVYTNWMSGEPASEFNIEMALKLYPEYFEDEINQRERFSKIPQDIKQKFLQELNEATERIDSSLSDPEKSTRIINVIRQGLIKKHFSKYSINTL